MSADVVRVIWSDNHQADYGVTYLRKRCPCAGCSAEIRKKSNPIFPPPPPPEKLEVTKVNPMGNYALAFQFNDGHNTGIYSFEYLRDICPCPQCAKAINLG